MKIYNNILETIGNTPVIKLNKLKKALSLKGDIYVKLESFNPLSSVKDRTAFALINDALKRGLIDNETKIIEATSGNTGIGLAFICAFLDINLIVVMPETMSEERKRLIKAFGATLILTEGKLGMKGAVAYQEKLLAENKKYIKMGQFENKANPDYHYDVTAMEIVDVFKKLDYFVSGIGTGGTVTGVGRRLKETYENIKIIGVEPIGSAILNGNPPGPHKIQGIGAGFIPEILNLSLIDKVMDISDDDAFNTSRLLAKTEGIIAGISSGAALFAAIQIAKKENKQILAILPDSGERYLSTELYNV